MEHFDQKEKQLWANMPDNTKKWYNNRLSQMKKTERFWPIIFTRPPEYKLQSHKDWLSRIWIWDTQEKKWHGKISLKFEIKKSFIEYEYQKVVALIKYEENNGSDAHRIVIYDFSSIHICDYSLDVSKGDYNSFFCSMQQQDVIMCGMNSNQIVEIRLDESKCYDYGFPFKRGTSFIKLIYSYSVDPKVRIIVTEINVYKKRQVHILIVHMTIEHRAASIISHTQDWKDVRTIMINEWTLPCQLFPNIIVTTDENNMYISGMNPILLSSLSDLAGKWDEQ